MINNVIQDGSRTYRDGRKRKNKKVSMTSETLHYHYAFTVER